MRREQTLSPRNFFYWGEAIAPSPFPRPPLPQDRRYCCDVRPVLLHYYRTKQISFGNQDCFVEILITITFRRRYCDRACLFVIWFVCSFVTLAVILVSRISLLTCYGSRSKFKVKTAVLKIFHLL